MCDPIAHRMARYKRLYRVYGKLYFVREKPAPPPPAWYLFPILLTICTCLVVGLYDQLVGEMALRRYVTSPVIFFTVPNLHLLAVRYLIRGGT